MKCDKYMGMDVHQAMTVVVVLDAEGKVIRELSASLCGRVKISGFGKAGQNSP